jgi:hypothetical protein
MTTAFASKLNGIEAGADVTDSTNVNAAGAVMESDYSPSHSILVQQSGTGSPSSLSIGNNTLVGRLSGGGSAIDDLSASQVRTLLNVEDGADVTDAANVASVIHAATSKTTPVDADEIPIADSAASFGLKKLTFANLKAALNTLYVALTGNQTVAGNKTFSGDTVFTSTTRPTSSGTGTPAATSLITLTDAVDFIANPNNIIVRDDFINGGNATTTIGDLGWFSFSSGGGTGASITGPLAVFPNIGARILTCGNATNAGQVIYLPNLANLLTYAGWEICFVVKLNQTTDCDLIVGFTKDNGAIGIGKFGGISFGARYSSATDTDFMFYSKNTILTFAANDANNYAISSGVAAGTTYNTFRIRSTVAGALQMSINDGSFVAVDTSSITTSGVFIPFFYIATRTTTSKSIDADFFSMKIQGVAR